MKNSRIIKWEQEIDRILEQQKDFDQKCTEKIRSLRRKISCEEKKLQVENNELIADAVRDALGEVNAENIALFREKMQLLVGLEDETSEGSQDNSSIYSG